MRKVQIRIIYILLVIGSLCSCSGEADLGVLKVEGIDNVCVRLFQDREFDNATAVYYQLIVGTETITPKRFLLGTDTYETNTGKFRAKSVDSIVFTQLQKFVPCSI